MVIFMTILSDEDIENSIKNSELGIEPFNQKNLTPNGYDLSIDEVYIKKNRGTYQRRYGINSTSHMVCY